MNEYTPRFRVEEDTQSTKCAKCGEEPSEHEKQKVFHENGRWSWDYYCGGEQA